MITSIEISDAKTWPRQPAGRLSFNLMCYFCIKSHDNVNIKNLSENNNHIIQCFARANFFKKWPTVLVKPLPTQLLGMFIFLPNNTLCITNHFKVELFDYVHEKRLIIIFSR